MNKLTENAVKTVLNKSFKEKLSQKLDNKTKAKLIVGIAVVAVVGVACVIVVVPKIQSPQMAGLRSITGNPFDDGFNSDVNLFRTMAKVGKSLYINKKFTPWKPSFMDQDTTIRLSKKALAATKKMGMSEEVLKLLAEVDELTRVLEFLTAMTTKPVVSGITQNLPQLPATVIIPVPYTGIIQALPDFLPGPGL
jgi:hypothetical protein